MPRGSRLIGRLMVVGLVIGPRSRARVRGALAGRADVQFCELRGELLPLAATTCASAVIAEPRDCAGDDVSEAVAALRAGMPSVPVIAYVADDRATSGDILAMARAGVHDLVRAGFDDVGFALGAALASASAACATSSVREALAEVVAPDAWPFVSYCLTRAHAPISVRAAADALGLDRRTLVRRLERAGLPQPRRVAGWCRIVAAARLLEEPIYTLEQAALRLEFPSGTALRNMMLRYTGLRPREIRENGGVRCVLHLLKREIGAARPVGVRPPASA
jgi:AraC-like DNA-binding protein